MFKDKKTGEELCSYTVRGTFEGELESTIELLAYEKGIPKERIETEIRNK